MQSRPARTELEGRVTGRAVEDAAAPLAIIEASARDCICEGGRECICEGGRRPANELLSMALARIA